MTVAPDTIWLLAGVVVAAMVGILRKYTNLSVADRDIKQYTALAFSIISTLVIPLISKQPIPDIGTLIVQVLATWSAAMGTYALTKTAVAMSAQGLVNDAETAANKKSVTAAKKVVTAAAKKAAKKVE